MVEDEFVRVTKSDGSCKWFRRSVRAEHVWWGRYRLRVDSEGRVTWLLEEKPAFAWVRTVRKRRARTCRNREGNKESEDMFAELYEMRCVKGRWADPEEAAAWERRKKKLVLLTRFARLTT